MSGLAATVPYSPSAAHPAVTFPPTPDTGALDAAVIPFPLWTAAAGPAPVPRPTALQLDLLGGFRLLVGGEPARIGSTGERVLAVIACRGRQASRRQVAQALWPDATTDRAMANLRTVLYRMCRRLPVALHVTSSHVQLSLGVQVDLEQATRLARRVLLHHGGEDRSLLDEAMRANLHDDLLPDWDEEWLDDHQYRHRQLRLTALERLATSFGAAGYHGAAIQAALSAVQADPLRESAHESLIRAHVVQGNRHEAFQHYMAYRRVLRDELGVDPPADLDRLLTGA